MWLPGVDTQIGKYTVRRRSALQIAYDLTRLNLVEAVRVQP